MDPRLYIYQLRRPRVTNPTYNSHLINNSCFSIYSGGPLQNQNHSQEFKTQPKEESRLKASSHLSNYGSSLLKIEDKDIYNRQNQRYNIISMQPLSHQETIKKYPKFTLEDKDAYYYRKILNNDLQRKQQQSIRQNQNAKRDKIAGVPTYDIDSNKVALDLFDSYGSGPQKYQKFTPGMLNHSDEFKSFM